MCSACVGRFLFHLVSRTELGITLVCNTKLRGLIFCVDRIITATVLSDVVVKDLGSNTIVEGLVLFHHVIFLFDCVVEWHDTGLEDRH